uniref:Uncharacterized protein n=1 Tax=Anguilla anguilla TaxID=7936 RepID=A0A0E9TFV4_ANGAN
MDSCCLRQILTPPSVSCSRPGFGQDLSDQAMFFQPSVIQFW